MTNPSDVRERIKVSRDKFGMRILHKEAAKLLGLSSHKLLLLAKVNYSCYHRQGGALRTRERRTSEETTQMPEKVCTQSGPQQSRHRERGKGWCEEEGN